MPIVDPEAAAAAVEALKARAAATASEPGAKGAVGRCGEPYAALVQWLMAEREAGTHFPDLATASAHIAGAFMASVALSISRPGSAEVLAHKIAVEAAACAQDLAGASHDRFYAPVHEGQRQ